MQHKTWVEIDLKQIEQNLLQINSLLSEKTQLMTVVKSNAYGHGLIEVAKVAKKSGAKWLGVDNLNEALAIKNTDIDLPVLILGHIVEARLHEAAENDFSFVAYNKSTIDALGGLDVPVKIHLKIETGTMRQGLFIKDLPDVLETIKKHQNIKLEGIYTHFADIEDTTDHSFAMEQLSKFKQALEMVKKEGIEPLAHTACSAAIILYPETHFDLVRLGLSMYGYWPSPQTIVSAKNAEKSIELFPALSWKTRIAQIKEIEAGTPIGYGQTEKAEASTRIAVIPVGYWDGYDRGLSGIGRVLIGGKRCKVVGRVCMNMCMVDVGHVEDLKIDDEVVLIGKQGNEEITIEEMAQKLGTINYEIISRINPLIPRIYM